MLGTLSEKNGIMWGKFPKGGGRGLTPTHSIFFSVFFNSGAYKMAKKTVKKCENSQTGGRGGDGSPLGNFSHIIPFFSDHVP